MGARIIRAIVHAGFALLLADGVWAQEKRQWQELAAYWAPVVAQSTQSEFRSDVFTAFDYDGDWDGTNNAVNRTRRYTMPSVVYYWIQQTASYHYIGYAFYYTRSRLESDSEAAEARVFDHDMQGVVLAIAKSANNPMGRFEALLTWGDGRHRLATEQSPYPADPDVRVLWDRAVIRHDTQPENATDIDFVIDGTGVHPVIYSEAGWHRFFSRKADTTIPAGPTTFEAAGVVDWRGWPGIGEAHGRAGRNRGGRAHRPGNPAISGWPGGDVPPDDGLIYRYEGFPFAVITERSAGRGTVLHHWNLIGYDLHPIDALWERRHDHETGPFAGYGIFAADGGPGPSARPPWAHALFFDPAAAFELTPDEAITTASFTDPGTLAGERAKGRGR